MYITDITTVAQEHVRAKLQGRTISEVQINTADDQILLTFDDGSCLSVYTDQENDLVVSLSPPSGD